MAAVSTKNTSSISVVVKDTQTRAEIAYRQPKDCGWTMVRRKKKEKKGDTCTVRKEKGSLKSSTNGKVSKKSES